MSTTTICPQRCTTFYNLMEWKKSLVYDDRVSYAFKCCSKSYLNLRILCKSGRKLMFCAVILLVNRQFSLFTCIYFIVSYRLSSSFHMLHFFLSLPLFFPSRSRIGFICFSLYLPVYHFTHHSTGNFASSQFTTFFFYM